MEMEMEREQLFNLFSKKFDCKKSELLAVLERFGLQDDPCIFKALNFFYTSGKIKSQEMYDFIVELYSNEIEQLGDKRNRGWYLAVQNRMNKEVELELNSISNKEEIMVLEELYGSDEFLEIEEENFGTNININKDELQAFFEDINFSVIDEVKEDVEKVVKITNRQGMTLNKIFKTVSDTESLLETATEMDFPNERESENEMLIEMKKMTKLIRSMNVKNTLYKYDKYLFLGAIITVLILIILLIWMVR